MSEPNRRYFRYIALRGEKGVGGIYGFFGEGETVDEALANLKKAAGRRGEGPVHVEEFWSELPFAPKHRTANDDEADAYVCRDGSINWVRCHREVIQ